MKNIRNRVAVVTGAGSGIGRAIAHSLAGRGCLVACADINLQSAEATARELETMGVLAKAFLCDVSKVEQVEQLVLDCEQSLGPVAILVNNAGVAVAGPVERMTMADWEWQLGPNLYGVIHGVHSFLPGMIERGEGHIVNIASVAGLIGSPHMTAYCTSKHAVVGFSESLGFELDSRNIGVTVVCPGFVDTNIFAAAKTLGISLRDSDLRRIALKPEVLGEMVVDAIQKNKAMLVATGHGKLLYFLKRFMPLLWRRIGRRLAQEARKSIE